VAACLAYIWIVYLGSICVQEGWGRVIHHSDRCDLSLFQLGLRMLEHLLNEGLSILGRLNRPIFLDRFLGFLYLL